jgi:hypothetical protein
MNELDMRIPEYELTVVGDVQMKREEMVGDMKKQREETTAGIGFLLLESTCY